MVSVPHGAKMKLQFHSPDNGVTVIPPSEVITVEEMLDTVARLESDQRDTLARLKAQISAMEEQVAEVLRNKGK